MRAFALTLVALCSACSGMRTSVEYDRGIDFARFHTYAWGAREGASSQAIDRRIRAAVDGQLAKKGFVRVEQGGDLEVRYRATLDASYEVTTWEHGREPRWAGMPAEADVRRVSIGALQVDLLEGSSRRLAWRGRGVGKLSADPSAEERAARIDEGAARLFRSFPPRRK